MERDMKLPFEHPQCQYEPCRRMSINLNSTMNMAADILSKNVSVKGHYESKEYWLDRVKDFAKKHHLIDYHLFPNRISKLKNGSARKLKGLMRVYTFHIGYSICLNYWELNYILVNICSSLWCYPFPLSDLETQIHSNLALFFNLNGTPKEIKYLHYCYEEWLELAGDNPLNEMKERMEMGYLEVIKYVYSDYDSYLLRKCETNKFTKVVTTLPTYSINDVVEEETDILSFTNAKPKNNVVVKYVRNEYDINLNVYGSSRSDCLSSITTKCGKYCLWLPCDVKDALVMYYKRYGGRKTREMIKRNCPAIDGMFNLFSKWKRIKAMCSYSRIVDNLEITTQDLEFVVCNYLNRISQALINNNINKW